MGKQMCRARSKIRKRGHQNHKSFLHHLIMKYFDKFSPGEQCDISNQLVLLVVYDVFCVIGYHSKFEIQGKGSPRQKQKGISSVVNFPSSIAMRLSYGRDKNMEI